MPPDTDRTAGGDPDLPTKVLDSFTGRRYKASVVRRRLIVAATATVGFVAALVVVRTSPTSAPPDDRPNVILILVDTLRADHLGIYGYDRPTSPNVDRFFADGIVFESARSQAACTFPSANSLLTSRDATEFLGKPHGDFGIPDDFVSIAEILQESGYRTIAVSASPIVRGTPSHHNLIGGFERGFDVFDESCLWNSAECVNASARNALTAKPRTPFLLYLHYMDPHDPYGPPLQHPRQFARTYAGHAFIAEGSPNPIVRSLYGWGKKVPPQYPAFNRKDLTPRDLEHLVDLYDDEIAYFDQQFAILLRILAERNALTGSIIAFVSDHGEQFLEHEHIKHCLGSLHDEAIRTPFMVRAPEQTRGRRVASPVSNLDLVPTLLELASVDPGDEVMRGKSLARFFETGVEAEDLPTPRYVFSAQGTKRCATDGQYKLMLDFESPERLLYDLSTDPGEQHNLADTAGSENERLRQALGEWIREVEGPAAKERGIRSARAVEERLRAIGYLP